MVDLDGPVHVVRHDGPSDGPTFVLVHGLGGHHGNWVRLAPPLAERGSVLIPDLRGFGVTPLGPHRSTLEHNQAMLARLIRREAGGDAIVVGNSTGGLLTLRLAVAEPGLARGAILVDAAVPGGSTEIELRIALSFAALMIPRLGEQVTRHRTRKYGFEAIARDTLQLCTVDPDLVPPDVFEAHMAMAREREAMPWAGDAFVQLARSLVVALLRRRRFLAMVDEVAAPVLMLHGAQDRLVPAPAARAIAARRTDWGYVEFPHLGHAPMLEDPGALIDAIDDWLTGPAARLLNGAA